MKGDDTLKAELAKALAECEYLREENARLKHRVGEAPDMIRALSGCGQATRKGHNQWQRFP